MSPWLLTYEDKVIMDRLRKECPMAIKDEGKVIMDRLRKECSIVIKDEGKVIMDRLRTECPMAIKDEGKVIMDRLRKECPMVIKDAMEKYFTDLGAKLATPSTGQRFIGKCMIPRFPPFFVQDKFITDCKENASIFNIFFSSQYTPLSNDSELPTFE